MAKVRIWNKAESWEHPRADSASKDQSGRLTLTKRKKGAKYSIEVGVLESHEWTTAEVDGRIIANS